MVVAAWNAGTYRGIEWILESLNLHVSHVEARTPGAQAGPLTAPAGDAP